MRSETGQLVFAALSDLLDQACASDRLRAFEGGASTAPLWTEIAELGFADLLLSEESGGAGLDLPEFGELVVLFGRQLLPVPLAETVVARAIIHDAGQAVPAGPIVLATIDGAQGTAETASIPLARAASHALVDDGEALRLFDLAPEAFVSAGIDRSLSARLRLRISEGSRFRRAGPSLRVIGASLDAALMAGMMSRLVDLSVGYANDRRQFGKPIGSFQAVQQQLAVLAEESAAARTAAMLGFPEAGGFEMLRAAIAKMRAGAAAAKAAAIAHAIHGAMGISEEYDLQLYSRRLIDYRLANGTESYWAAEIGRRRLADPGASSLEFVRRSMAEP